MLNDQQLEPTEMHPGRNGGTLRTGNPGNRGNPNGRTPRILVKERAGRVLRLLLIDLEALRLARAGRLTPASRACVARFRPVSCSLDGPSTLVAARLA